MNKIEIGLILKAQGLKGEVKIKPYTDASVFENLDYIYINGENEKREIVKSTYRMGYAYLTLKGIDDRTSAEQFSGKEIAILKEDLKINDGEYIIDDFINMKVFLSTGEEVGEITEVEQYGSADILTIFGKTGKWQVPYIHDLVESVDKDNKVMVLNAKRFDEVKV